MSQSLTSQSLLDRFDVSTDDLALLKECGDVLGNKIDSVVDRFYEWLQRQPEFNVFFSSQDTVERVKRLQKVYWADFFSGVVDQRYIDYRVHIGELHAQRDMPNLIYFAAMLRFQLLFLEELQDLWPCQGPTAAHHASIYKAPDARHLCNERSDRPIRQEAGARERQGHAGDVHAGHVDLGGCSSAALGRRCRLATHARHHGEDVVAHC